MPINFETSRQVDEQKKVKVSVTKWTKEKIEKVEVVAE